MDQSWTGICSPNAAMKSYFPHQSGVLDTFIYLFTFFPLTFRDQRCHNLIDHRWSEKCWAHVSTSLWAGEELPMAFEEVNHNDKIPCRWFGRTFFFFFFSTTIWRQFCSWRVVVQGQKKKRSHKLKCFCSRNLKGIRKRKKKTLVRKYPRKHFNQITWWLNYFAVYRIINTSVVNLTHTEVHSVFKPFYNYISWNHFLN